MNRRELLSLLGTSAAGFTAVAAYGSGSAEAGRDWTVGFDAVEHVFRRNFSAPFGEAEVVHCRRQESDQQCQFQPGSEFAILHGRASLAFWSPSGSA
jgi:hypothetical protein